jgi:hypothetical protein
LTLAGAEVSPERDTVTTARPVPSGALYSRALNCTVGTPVVVSLSTISHSPRARAMVAFSGVEISRKKFLSGSATVSP